MGSRAVVAKSERRTDPPVEWNERMIPFPPFRPGAESRVSASEEVMELYIGL